MRIAYVKLDDDVGAATDGNFVFDNALVGCLKNHAEVTVLPIARRKGSSYRSLARGRLPLYDWFEEHPSWKDLQSKITVTRFDQVIYSGEWFMPRYEDGQHENSIFLLHNVHGATRSPDPIDNVYALLGRRLERRVLPRLGRIAFITRSDELYVKQAYGFFGKSAVVPAGVRHGLPPELGDDAPERIISVSGSLGWYRKRRDMTRFIKSIPTDSNIRFQCEDESIRTLFGQHGRGHLSLPIQQKSSQSSAIGFGLITDRFTTGFKLKALDYLSLGQIVLSYSSINEEILAHPHAEEFCHVVDDYQDVETIVNLTLSTWDAATWLRFEKFRASIISSMTWQAAARSLMELCI